MSSESEVDIIKSQWYVIRAPIKREAMEVYDFTIAQWLQENNCDLAIVSERLLSKNLLRYYREVLNKEPYRGYAVNKSGRRSMFYLFTTEDRKFIYHVYTQLYNIEIANALLSSHALV